MFVVIQGDQVQIQLLHVQQHPPRQQPQQQLQQQGQKQMSNSLPPPLPLRRHLRLPSQILPLHIKRVKILLPFTLLLLLCPTHAQLHDYDPEVIDAILQVDILSISTPFTSLQGTIIHAISGSISAIGSMLIIYIISKSRNKLSSTYNRIMFGMSIMDIAESTMMVVSTLPMPSDMVYNQFRGLSIGNNATCQAQGAIVNGAGMGTLAYNSSLCLYYFCAITLNVRYAYISKYIEPALHLFSIGSAVFLGTIGIIGRFYNPMPYQSWCSVASFPYWCNSGNDSGGYGNGVVTGEYGSLTEYDECQINALTGGRGEKQSTFAQYIFYLYVVIYGTITITMTSVIVTVFRQHRILKRHMKMIERKKIRRRASLNVNDSGNRNANANSNANADGNDTIGGGENIGERSGGDGDKITKNHAKTKAIFVQAISYILACFMVQIFPTLNFNSSKQSTLYNNNTYALFSMIFFPLQGLYNFLIFVSHKVYTLRVADENITLIQALKKVLTHDEEPIVIISRISAVSVRDREEEYYDGHGDDFNFNHHNDHYDDEDGSGDHGLSYTDTTTTGRRDRGDNDNQNDNSNVIDNNYNNAQPSAEYISTESSHQNSNENELFEDHVDDNDNLGSVSVGRRSRSSARSSWFSRSTYSKDVSNTVSSIG